MNFLQFFATFAMAVDELSAIFCNFFAMAAPLILWGA